MIQENYQVSNWIKHLDDWNIVHRYLDGNLWSWSVSLVIQAGYLSGEGEDSESDTDDGRNQNGEGLEQLVEVVPGHVGPQVVDEAVDLAQAEDSKRLKETKEEFDWVQIPSSYGHARSSQVSILGSGEIFVKRRFGNTEVLLA